MRTRMILTTPIVVLSLLAAPAGAQQTGAGTDQEAMRLAREGAKSYVADFNAHDVAKLAAKYTPDADWTSFLGDEVGTRLEGRPSIEQFYREFFTNSPQIQVKLTPERARLITPDVLVGDYTWSFTNSTRGDRPGRGRTTTVALRRDGRWQDCCVRVVMTPASKTGVSVRQIKSGSNEEAMKLARELTDSYVAAYNAHDTAQLAARYTPDADWISFLGDEVVTRLEGRAAIERSYRDAFASSPQVQVNLTPEHARFVTPDVLVGDYAWSATNSTRTDRPSRGRGTVVSLRRDGQWLTCCVRLVMTPPGSAGQ